MQLIIDISRWQWPTEKSPPWDEIVGAGIVGCVCKATHGMGIDPYFKRGIREAREAGLITGAYSWLLPDRSARDQAKNYLDTFGPCPEEGLFVDFEEPNTLKRGRELTDHLEEFIEEVEWESRREMKIYTGNWYYVSFAMNVESLLLGSRPLWLSHYPRLGVTGGTTAAYAAALRAIASFMPPVPRPWADLGKREDLLQFDGDGGLTLPHGVDADFNLFRGDLAALREWFGRKKNDVEPILATARPAEGLTSTYRDDFLAGLFGAPPTEEKVKATIASSLSGNASLMNALRRVA